MKQEQIEALKYTVFTSEAGTELARRAVAFLIDQSELLSKEVCITLSEKSGGYAPEEILDAGHGVDALQHPRTRANVNFLLVAMGVDLLVSLHYGDFDPNRDRAFNSDGIFVNSPLNASPECKKEGMPMRYTFWLAEGPYSDEASLVTATKAELMSLEFQEPRPYKRLLVSS